MRGRFRNHLDDWKRFKSLFLQNYFPQLEALCKSGGSSISTVSISKQEAASFSIVSSCNNWKMVVDWPVTIGQFSVSCCLFPMQFLSLKTPWRTSACRKSVNVTFLLVFLEGKLESTLLMWSFPCRSIVTRRFPLLFLNTVSWSWKWSTGFSTAPRPDLHSSSFCKAGIRNTSYSFVNMFSGTLTVVKTHLQPWKDSRPQAQAAC